MKRLAALALLLLLGSCAEVWERPDATEEQADAANAECREASGAAVPPRMSLQIVRPARIEREEVCRSGEQGRTRCRTIERYRPAEWDWVDTATGQRDAWRRQCMVEKGFAFRGYRPLRLH